MTNKTTTQQTIELLNTMEYYTVERVSMLNTLQIAEDSATKSPLAVVSLLRWRQELWVELILTRVGVF